MTYTFEEIKTTIEKCAIPQEIQNDNIFEIGTRGFYENPFTEVLAYIISSKSHYKHRIEFTKLFLKSIKTISDKVIESFEKEIYIETQHTTLGGNYIDLLIYNSNFILVFENKIEHLLNNPLKEYKENIKNRYSQKPYFFVLSFNQVETPKLWKNVVIRESFTSIKSGLPKEFKDKWDFFVEDFLNHYIQPISKPMEKAEFEFYAQNFSKIFAANNQVDQFISDVSNRVINKLQETQKNQIGSSLQKNWDGGIAIRFRPVDGKDDDVVLVFGSNGKFTIAIYYCQPPQTHLQELYKRVGSCDYKSFKEGSFSCFARLDGKEFCKVEEAVDECVAQLTKMIDYYDNKDFASDRLKS